MVLVSTLKLLSVGQINISECSESESTASGASSDADSNHPTSLAGNNNALAYHRWGYVQILHALSNRPYAIPNVKRIVDGIPDTTPPF